MVTECYLRWMLDSTNFRLDGWVSRDPRLAGGDEICCSFDMIEKLKFIGLI